MQAKLTRLQSLVSTPSQLPITFSNEVRQAFESQRSGLLVALESTIITHGMPYPHNKTCAEDVEKEVRANGAIPATIAILEGVIHIGLENTELDWLASLGTKGTVMKCSRRDLPFVLALKKHGSLTVSATMYIAHLVGISIFVTGGIGGVHRDGHSSMDVSADLTELGRTPVFVVSAGVKSILDIPRTLEVLETQGVTVATYQSNVFPAFFTRNSGVNSPMRVDSLEDAAQVVKSMKTLAGSGVLFAVPIPESASGNAETVERAIQQALKEAEEKHIVGNAVTPYVLKRVHELTKGQSLSSNIALIRHNAQVGAQIAVHVFKQKN